jgi:hypothetical protein
LYKNENNKSNKKPNTTSKFTEIYKNNLSNDVYKNGANDNSKNYIWNVKNSPKDKQLQKSET